MTEVNTKKIFYGAAIQGDRKRGSRSLINRNLIDTINSFGFKVVCEHTAGNNFQESAELLNDSLGEMPAQGLERTVFIRNRMIQLVEGDIQAAVFEVSVPSLGTGIELAHAYLRPRLGLKDIPILALYELNFWPNGLSSMIKGLYQDSFPGFHLRQYRDLSEACAILGRFLQDHFS